MSFKLFHLCIHSDEVMSSDLFAFGLCKIVYIVCFINLMSDHQAVFALQVFNRKFRIHSTAKWN